MSGSTEKNAYAVRTVIAAAMLCLTGAATVQAANNQGGWTGTWKGQSAELQFSDAKGGGRLAAFQTSAGAYLIFAAWENDLTSYTCTIIYDQNGNPIEVCSYTRVNFDYGWGPVEAGGIQFNATFARLNTITGAGSSIMHCVLDRSGTTPVTTCGPGFAYGFDLTWTLNGFYTTSGSGPATETYGSFSIKTGGGYRGSSAFVNGSYNGRDLYEAPGTLNDTKGTNVSRAIIPTQ